MTRKRKFGGNEIMVGDVVELRSSKDPGGDVLGTGVVDQLSPMHGSKEIMVWVKGFPPHHPDAAKKIGTVQDLIGRINMLNRENESLKKNESALTKDLAAKSKDNDALEASIAKTFELVSVVNGVEMMDVKGALKWIKDSASKHQKENSGNKEQT